MKLDIVHEAINRIGAQHVKSTTGRDIYSFQTRGREAVIQVVLGDDVDTTSYECLVFSSQDLTFVSKQTWIHHRYGLDEFADPDELLPTGDAAFDKCYAILTDRPAFTQQLLTPPLRAALIKLEPLHASVEFEQEKTAMLSKLLGRLVGRGSGPSTICRFTLEIQRFPDTAALMDTFLRVGLALLHDAATASELPSCCSGSQPAVKKK